MGLNLGQLFLCSFQVTSHVTSRTGFRIYEKRLKLEMRSLQRSTLCERDAGTTDRQILPFALLDGEAYVCGCDGTSKGIAESRVLRLDHQVCRERWRRCGAVSCTRQR